MTQNWNIPHRFLISFAKLNTFYIEDNSTFQKQALTALRLGVSEDTVGRLRSDFVGALTPDLSLQIRQTRLGISMRDFFICNKL